MSEKNINIENNEVENIEVENNEVKKTIGNFTYNFTSPVLYKGMEITEIHINLDTLTGSDARAIEEELRAAGKFVSSPAFDNNYLCKMLAKGCDKIGEINIGDDFFLKLGLRDYNKLCGKARAFFISSEE